MSHMSLTSTTLNGSPGFRNRLARASLPLLPRMCFCQSTGSDAEPVITTLISPLVSSSSSHSGRSLTSSL